MNNDDPVCEKCGAPITTGLMALTCQHDQKRFGLFGLPKEANGCSACAYELAQARITASDWQQNYPYPVGGKGVWIEVLFHGGYVERMPLMAEGQWSDSHYADLLSAYPRGHIKGWRYVTASSADDARE
jgi:hypothetical protein